MLCHTTPDTRHDPASARGRGRSRLTTGDLTQLPPTTTNCNWQHFIIITFFANVKMMYMSKKAIKTDRTEQYYTNE